MGGLELNEEMQDLYYNSLGRMAEGWAFIEIVLDRIIYVAATYMDGGTLVGGPLPVSLGNKIDYLKRAFKRIPRLADLCAEGRSCLIDVKRLGAKRHDLLHGLAMTQTSLGVYEFLRISYEDGGHRDLTVTYGIHDIINLHGENADLMERLCTILDAMKERCDLQ